MPKRDSREAMNAYNRAYYWKHRDKNRAKLTAQAAARRAKMKAEEREAIRAKERERRRNNPAHKRAVRKYLYGITQEQYDELLAACSGKCPVCLKRFDRTPNIDHCHKTGMVRGLLCHRCNSAEGILRNPENALRLYKYMLKNELFYGGEKASS